MHFSIPETGNLRDEKDTYTVYNVHVNGVFHCAVRYSQLYDFHAKLKVEFGASLLPPFPPKKLLSLSPAQIEERREKLEKFIQNLSQDPRIANSSLFNSFFLNAQQESQREDPENVTLDVYLMNGNKITVDILSTDRTDNVLESVTSQIGLPDDLVYYFALFLVKKEDHGQPSIVRKMQEFESPYISLKTAVGTHRIVIRKNIWDLSYEDDLLGNNIARNILFVQAVSDVERGWILSSKEQKEHLQLLNSKGSKKEYLRLARTMKYYGYIRFKSCRADYPKENCSVDISAGNYELNFRVKGIDGKLKEGSFKVTRIRCWRITTTYQEQKEAEVMKKPSLELAFEYLIAKDTLKWISISTDEAILISVCLQGMVDELVMKKQGGKIKRVQNRVNGSHRGGKFAEPPSASTNLSDSESLSSKSKEAVKKISEKIQSSFGISSGFQSSGLIENDIFEDIGDDDL